MYYQLFSNTRATFAYHSFYYNIRPKLNILSVIELAWIYEIHHFQLKFESIYRKVVKIIAITYFLAILATKIAITRYLIMVSSWD